MKRLFAMWRTKGVQTRMLFSRQSDQSTRALMKCDLRQVRAIVAVSTLENTDRIMRDTFWVGVYPGMTDEMIDYMAKTIAEAVYA